MAVSHPIMNRFLFTEEIWACIDTIKTCQTIDGELKSLQLRFKKMRVSDSLASCRDKVKLQL